MSKRRAGAKDRSASASPPTMPPASWRDRLHAVRPDAWFWGILALGATFRLYFLDEPFRGDENFTFLNYAIQPVAHIVSSYDVPNNHVFHSLLMHAAYLAFPHTAPAWRLPSFVSGIAAIYLTYVFAHLAVRDRWAANLSALFVALSQPMVYYATNGRGYAIQSACVLGLAIVAFAEWPWQRRARILTLLVALGFMLLYTVPTGIVFLIPYYLFLFWDDRPGILARRGTVFNAGVLTVLCCLVAYWPILEKMLKNSTQTGNTFEILRELARNSAAGIAPAPLFLSAAAVGWWVHPERRVRRFLGLSLLLYLTLGTLANALKPGVMFFERSYVILYPFAFVLFAIACVEGRRFVLARFAGRAFISTALTATVSCSLAAYSLFKTTEVVLDPSALYYPTRDLRRATQQLTRQLTARMQPDERILGRGPCDESTATYAIEGRGTASWWLWRLYSQPVKRVYILANDQKEFDAIYREAFDRRFWNPPPADLARGGAVTVYQARRQRLGEPLPRDLGGFVN